MKNRLFWNIKEFKNLKIKSKIKIFLKISKKFKNPKTKIK